MAKWIGSGYHKGNAFTGRPLDWYLIDSVRYGLTIDGDVLDSKGRTIPPYSEEAQKVHNAVAKEILAIGAKFG